MPYKRKGNCVYKLNSDGSLGSKVGCSVDAEKAKKYLKALYARVPDAKKKESMGLKELKDKVVAVMKGEKPIQKNQPFVVHKDANGKSRWIAYSSNAFQDTDKETVSHDALIEDTARMQETNDYGPLRWWHVGVPNLKERKAGIGLDIGDCDFSAMHGLILVESGTFKDEKYAEVLKEHSDELQVSRSFFHNLDTEPDNQKVFHHIQGFERSILPRGRAANTLTAFAVTKQESDMATFKEKADAFVKLFGGKKEIAEQTAQTAEQIEASAKELGIASKEAKHVHDDLVEHTHGEDGKPVGDVKEHTHEVTKEATLVENIKAVQKCYAEASFLPPTYADQEAMDISDATYAMNSIVRLISGEVNTGEPENAKLLAVTLDQLWAFIKSEVAGILEQAGGDTVVTKEEVPAVVQPTVEEMTAVVQKAIEPLAVANKEVADANKATKDELTKQLATLIARLDKAEARVATTEKEVKKLVGEQPRGFKASTDSSTVVKEKSKEIPSADPNAPVNSDFMQFAMTGQTPTATQ